METWHFLYRTVCKLMIPNCSKSFYPIPDSLELSTSKQNEILIPQKVLTPVIKVSHATEDPSFQTWQDTLTKVSCSGKAKPVSNLWCRVLKGGEVSVLMFKGYTRTGSKVKIKGPLTKLSP